MDASSEKSALLDAWLGLGAVFVRLDPRKADVVVPPHLRAQPELVLTVSRKLAKPIDFLRIDEDALSGTFSFSTTTYFCWIPWPAIFEFERAGFERRQWTEALPRDLHPKRPLGAPVRRLELRVVKKGQSDKPAFDERVERSALELILVRLWRRLLSALGLQSAPLLPAPHGASRPRVHWEVVR